MVGSMVTTRCEALIGRHIELDELTASLDQAGHTGGVTCSPEVTFHARAAFRPGVTFLTGESGVGKSRLTLELARIAAERGFTVLIGGATRATSPVRLRPIVEALTGLARTTPVPADPALAQYRSALASIVPGWNGYAGRDPKMPLLVLGEALLRLLTAMGGQGTLLVVEDLQFADPETLAIVEYLADNLRGERAACVATVQEGEPSAAMDMVRAVYSRRTAAVMQVGRLSEAEISQMAAACLEQATVPGPMLARLLADCDGLPFAVEEILAAAVSSGELVRGETGWSVDGNVATGVPESIARSVRRRLAGLSQDVADVVVAAALLGRQFDWTLLPGLTGATESVVLAGLRRACQEQLIEPQGSSQVIFRFRHSLTRNAILSSMGAADLSGRSAKAAAAITAAYPGLPGSWCELAAELHERANPHLPIARDVAGPAPALEGWPDAAAARCALDGGEPERALDLARRALVAAEAAGLRGSSAEAACEALEIIGSQEQARDAGEASQALWRAYHIASNSGLPDRQIRAMHELGVVQMLEGGGSRWLCEARRLAAESGAISACANIDLQLATAWSFGPDLGQALEAAQRCEQAARSLEMRRVEAMALSVQASILARTTDQARAESMTEHAERLAPDDPAALTSVWGEAKATAAIFGNDLPRAHAACSKAISYARTDPLTAPSLVWGLWPLLQTVAGGDGHRALAEARRAGADVAFWNRGCLAFTEAVLAGRDGRPGLACEHAERGSKYFEQAAPCWNHAMHRLIAPDAFQAGWGEPARWLRAAIGDLDLAGLGRLASACRGVLRMAGQSVPRCGRGNARVPGQLRTLGVTSREMDVLLLVASGKSNAEIATRLFISPKTVETHVGSLISKTGRSGRRELAAHAPHLVPTGRSYQPI
jgi:DNA-binding CsgD family transcriptional regulator/tetratricopeptide (TPR) repeat protein